MKKVAVIGGGITGLCTAYYLTREGYEVTVIDRNTTKAGASFINAGYLVPSHFVPLAEPGIISKGLKWMFDPSSPFYVKPRFDLDFFRWAWHFKRSASHRKVEQAIPVLKELNLKSRDLYAEMLETGGFDFHMERKGLLVVNATPEGEKQEITLANRAINEGLEVEILNGKALEALEPRFSGTVGGAVHYLCDAHMTPGAFMKDLELWLREKGVKFVLGQEVNRFHKRGGEIISVQTSQEVIEADEFVLAAGSWTFSLARSLDLFIPVQGGKGYSFDITRNLDINYPAILSEAKVAVTPMKSFTRFAGTMEFSGNNDIIREGRVASIARAANRYYQDLDLSPEEHASARSGLRPVSPDGLPFIGRAPRYKNLNIAAGHAMMGWSLGPVTGKLVTQVISGNTPAVDLRAFGPNRF